MNEMNTKELNEIIQKELIPAQQMFKAYEQLSRNSLYKFHPSIFRKCIIKIQRIIIVIKERGNDGENTGIP